MLSAYAVDATLAEPDQRLAALSAQGLKIKDAQNPAGPCPRKSRREIISASLEGLRELDAPQEATRVHEELVMAANRLDRSGLQLQDVATVRGIDVDLGCGE